MDEHGNHLIFSHDNRLNCRIPTSAFKHILSFDLVSVRSQLLIPTHLHLEKINSHEILNKNCRKDPKKRHCHTVYESPGFELWDLLLSLHLLLHAGVVLPGGTGQKKPVHAAANLPQSLGLTVCGSPNASVRS